MNRFRLENTLKGQTFAVKAVMSAFNGKDDYDRVFDLLKAHHKWFNESLPLIASENVTSAAVKEAIVSDFGHRYAEGWPGERVYAGCVYIDEVERIAIKTAKQLFDAEFVDVRPVSGVNANLVAYTVLANPGDTVMALSIPNGGHISYGRNELGGTAGSVRGLKVEYLVFDQEQMNIDVDATVAKVKKLQGEGKTPKLVIFGASVFLFPHPVKELASFFKSIGASVMYDGAHVLGLIAGKQFQDPLREGVDVLTGSTHKTLPGPQGGMVISWRRLENVIKRATFPGNVSNHHLHHVAGKAVAFAEMLAFGREYAAEVVKNAQALAEGLSTRGIPVFGEKLGYTKSHQVLVDVTKYGDGGTLEKKLESANIIVNRNMIPLDIKAGRHFEHPGGLRFGVQELTRLGMGKSEMDHVASLIADVVVKGCEPLQVVEDVKELRRGFQKVMFSFDTQKDAYAYVTIR
jgi:glycine hydroxymethyltransferase